MLCQKMGWYQVQECPVQRCSKQAYNQRVALLCTTVGRVVQAGSSRHHVDTLVSTLHSTYSMHVFLTS